MCDYRTKQMYLMVKFKFAPQLSVFDGGQETETAV